MNQLHKTETLLPIADEVMEYAVNEWKVEELRERTLNPLPTSVIEMEDRVNYLNRYAPKHFQLFYGVAHEHYLRGRPGAIKSLSAYVSYNFSLNKRLADKIHKASAMGAEYVSLDDQEVRDLQETLHALKRGIF